MEPTPYWELTDQQRVALPDAHIGEDENIVLWKINQARTVIRAAEDYPPASRRSLEPWGRSDLAEYTYYDLIASLLMSAAHDGFDPDQLCTDALDQMRSFMADGRCDALALRPAPEPPEAPGAREPPRE